MDHGHSGAPDKTLRSLLDGVNDLDSRASPVLSLSQRLCFGINDSSIEKTGAGVNIGDPNSVSLTGFLAQEMSGVDKVEQRNPVQRMRCPLAESWTDLFGTELLGSLDRDRQDNRLGRNGTG